MKKNLALIGMSGTLKSTVGRRLAKKLQLLFIDTDDMIEFETGRSIPEIFELAGEDYFRSLERKLVASLSDYDGAVISTGGGIGADDENMRALSEHCTVIWLDATPRTIFTDSKTQSEPDLSLNRSASKRWRSFACCAKRITQDTPM